MSKKPTLPRSVATYPAEFFDIWDLASKDRLCLSFPTRGAAISMRQRLNTFRKRLREESPDLAGHYINCDLDIRATGNGDEHELISFVPDWKKQLAQLKEPAEPVTPMATASVPPTEQGHYMDPIVVGPPPESLDEALRSIGFTSDKT